MNATALTPTEAHWILTGYGNNDHQAGEILATMAHYGIDYTSTNLRDWAYSQQ